jgi:LuxR family transcriptional regulator, quorum-sensing system regulator BjaR1
MLMTMSVTADVDRVRAAANGAQVLDALEDMFRSVGAAHFLATGIPLPGRPMAPLVLRARWGEYRDDKAGMLNVPHSDAVLQRALRARRPFEWPAQGDGLRRDSTLLGLTGSPGDVSLVGVPISSFLPYQACVLGAGANVSFDPRMMMALDYLCSEAFARLFALNYMRRERPGELSARERNVVELSALGKTASDIASVLNISQRTVHAHLQNASEKLRANNKTQTVVEAIIYGQIEI